MRYFRNERTEIEELLKIPIYLYIPGSSTQTNIIEMKMELIPGL